MPHLPEQPSCICRNSNSRLEIPAPPSPHLITSNDVPSSEEQKHIDTYLADLTSRLAQIKHDTDHLRQLLARHERHRRKLEDLQQSYTRVVSRARIGRLPQEILGEIFIHWLAPNHDPEHPEDVPDTFHPTQGPMLLTHVCRWWRSAALATHELWTILRLRTGFQGLGGLGETARFELARMWIQRSGEARPLTIYVQVGEYVRLSRNHTFKILLLVASRWRHLFFRFVHPSGCSILPRLRQCVAPQLHTFYLSYQPTNGGEDLETNDSIVPNEIDILQPTQHVQCLVVDIPLSISSLHFSTRFLQEIYLYPHNSTRATIAECLSILMHALNLEIFYGPCEMEGISPVAHPITVPSLRQLVLTINDLPTGPLTPTPLNPTNANNASLFDLLIAPQLRDLKLKIPFPLPPRTFQSLDTFLALPEHTSITHLEFDAPHLRWRRFYPSLSHLSSLSHLNFFSHQRWSDTDLEPFLSDFLPSLECLRVRAKLRLTPDGFGRFFADRWWPADSRPVVPLRELVVEGVGESVDFVNESVVWQLEQGEVGSGRRVRVRVQGVVVYPVVYDELE